MAISLILARTRFWARIRSLSHTRFKEDSWSTNEDLNWHLKAERSVRFSFSNQKLITIVCVNRLRGQLEKDAEDRTCPKEDLFNLISNNVV